MPHLLDALFISLFTWMLEIMPAGASKVQIVSTLRKQGSEE